MKSSIFILVISAAICLVTSQGSTAPTGTATPSVPVSPPAPALPVLPTADSVPSVPATQIPQSTDPRLNALTPKERQWHEYLQQKVGNGVGNLPFASPLSFYRGGLGGMTNFVQNYDKPLTTGAQSGYGLIKQQIGSNLEFLGKHLRNAGDTTSRFNKQVNRGLGAIPLFGPIPSGLMEIARAPRFAKRLGRASSRIVQDIGQSIQNSGEDTENRAQLTRAQLSLQRKNSEVQQMLENQRLRQPLAQGQLNGLN